MACFLQMECCGWTSQQDWSGNMIIKNSSMLLFPCSCQNISTAAGNASDSGFCEAPTPDWPVYEAVSELLGVFVVFELLFCGLDALLPSASRVVPPAWSVGSSPTSGWCWESAWAWL